MLQRIIVTGIWAVVEKWTANRAATIGGGAGRKPRRTVSPSSAHPLSRSGEGHGLCSPAKIGDELDRDDG